jgi:osmotically-inducible protein OsmY
VKVAVVGLALVLSAGAVWAQEQTQGDLRTKVERKLSDEETLRNVKVTVEGTVVTLDGTVPSLWAKEKAIEESREVDGVTSIVSNLTITRRESDDAVGREVAEKIRRYVFYTIFDDVNVRVSDGAVTLTGSVVQPYRSTEIARLASRVAGVREVNNQIEVLPASISDEQLRVSIATQIYGHSLFTNYATQVNPPIHIIVNRGNVTLTGFVNSEVQRKTAEFIVRQTFGVFKVENKLELDSRT